MKNLLILTTTFPRWEGDSEAHFVYYLAKELLRWYDVTVLAPYHPSSKTEDVVGGVKVYRFRYWFKESLCYGSGILPNFKKSFVNKLQVIPFLFSFWLNAKRLSKKSDIINAWWSIPCGLIASTISKPYVLSTAGTDVMSIRKGFFNLFQKRAFNKAKKIVALSTFLHDEIKERYNKESYIIPIGIDLNDFVFKKEKNNLNLLLFVGRLNHQKGCDVLLRAMKIVTARYPETNLTIIGEGERKQELIKLSEELEIQKDVIFFGPVANKDLPAIYQNHDLFIFPSREYEGLGLVMVESMACGTPVIASAVGGVPNVIQDYKTGILFNDEDHQDLATEIINIIDNKKLYEELQTNGYEHVKENFVWNKIGEKYNEALTV